MEKIVAAAIQVKVDNIVSVYIGKRHGEIYEGIPIAKMNNPIEGFITNTNRFVDRYEAKEIAVAANQLIVPIEETYAELYSEDVW
jgi:hypothetical protein